jgi:hypothetical protein
VRRALVASVLALALAAPVTAQDGASKCTAAKLKALGAYYAALAGCAAKGVAKDQSPDPFCVTKAQVTLASRFEKAERKGDCRTYREAVPIQQLLEDGFGVLLEILEPPPSVCCAGSVACIWAPDADACAALGATAGAPETVCSAGACVAPPAVDGPCCEGATIPGLPNPVCGSSPLYDAANCANLGGTFVEDAVCLPAQICVD